MSGAGDVLVDIHEICLTLGGTKILDGVSLQVLDRVREGEVTGQVVALLGPSGVGKTRLLRIIAGLDAPDSGSVCGQEGAELPAGSVGYVFQDYPLLQHRTVRSNLELAGTIAGMSPADAAFRTRDPFDHRDHRPAHGEVLPEHVERPVERAAHDHLPEDP